MGVTAAAGLTVCFVVVIELSALDDFL